MNKSLLWRQATPWIYAALMSSFIPVFFLFIFPLKSSEYAKALLTGTYNTYDAFPFYYSTPFSGNFLATPTAVFYICAGIIMSKIIGPQTADDGLSVRISYAILSLSAALLFFTVPILSTVFTIAIKYGYIPSGEWGIHEGNHGPWRHLFFLRRLLENAMFQPLLALPVAMSSLPFKPTKAAVVLSAASVFAFFASILCFQWFID